MKSLKPILSKASTVYFKTDGYEALNTLIQTENYSKVFILVDSHTMNHCLPLFLSNIETTCTLETIEIDAGEQHKTLETCQGVWMALSELGADRKCLIINVGGGVVTDLGGFVACTFKRGVDYVNVPTSLLAMVDASVGGKTGVDLGHLKNQIGVISESRMVLIDTAFLNTLPSEELKSGHAEILKHGLIASQSYWEKATDLKSLTIASYDDLIYESVRIKNTIVCKDPNEQGMRKALNYGHTLGHAIESYCLENTNKNTLLHGEAIAIGMILATYLSISEADLNADIAQDINQKINDIYPKVSFSDDDIIHIVDLLQFDKKNSHGNVNFVLLKNFGKMKFDCIIAENKIRSAFDYYQAL